MRKVASCTKVGGGEGVSLRQKSPAQSPVLPSYPPLPPFVSPRPPLPPPHQDAEAFKLDAGDFDTLEEVAADVAVTKGSWDRYDDFLRKRNEIANMDWLSMRDQVRGG